MKTAARSMVAEISEFPVFVKVATMAVEWLTLSETHEHRALRPGVDYRQAPPRRTGGRNAQLRDDVSLFDRIERNRDLPDFMVPEVETLDDDADDWLDRYGI